jgi:di/tricarboxylate transporter
MISSPEIGLIIVTLTTFVIIVWNRLPVEIVALLLLSVLGFSGLVPPSKVMSGFSSSVVITLIGLFVITHTLEETGVVHNIADRLNRVGGGSEARLIVLLMTAGALMSLVMNNVAAGAVLLPAAVRVARISKVRISKLLIPLSFGTMLGGMATYLTTANILLSSLLIDNGLDGLSMLDFIPTGGLIALAGIAYMLFIGRRLLPDRESITESTMPADLQKTYKLEERTWEVRVDLGSQLAWRSLKDSGIGHELGLTVLAIWRGHQAIFNPEPDEIIKPDDFLLILGRKERLDMLLEWGTKLRNGPNSKDQSHQYSVNVTEVIIPPRSQAVGQSLQQLNFRNRFGLTAVAIWREGRSFRTDVGLMELRVGDALLVVGYPERIKQLAVNRNYLIPSTGYYSEPIRPQKAITALIITAVVLLLAIFDLLPIPQVMLAGAVTMVLSGSLKMDEFYAAIEWKVIFLIAGMLPLGTAMIETGLANRVGLALVNALSGYHAVYLVMGLTTLTMLITQIIGSQVTALLVGPIAISTAMQMGISPQAMAVAVAIGCSTAFLTPIAHPVNVLMMGPGGYRFGDFLKVGLGMTIVTLITLFIGLVLIWGVR